MPEPAAHFTMMSSAPSPMVLTDRYMVRPPRKADRPMVSPLMLTDRLISLAEDAERAGFPTVAGRLVRLAMRTCAPPPAAAGTGVSPAQR